MCEAVFQLLIYTWVVGVHVDTIEKVVFFLKNSLHLQKIQVWKNYLFIFLSLIACFFFFLEQIFINPRPTAFKQ